MSVCTESTPEIIPCDLPDVSQIHFKTDIFEAMASMTAKDFVSPEPVLIDGLLHEGHRMILCGPAKAGKSYLVTDLAIAIACGGEWLGHKCKQGNVFICNIENGALQTQNRIEQICEQRAISKDSMKHITVIEMKSYAEITTFINAIIENIQPGLYSAIIIDSIYNFLYGRESQSEYVDYFLKEINRLAVTLKSSIILCHHVKKATEGYTSPIDMIAGSSILSREPQTLIAITKVYEQSDCKKERIYFTTRFFTQHPPLNVVFKNGIFSIVSKSEKSTESKDAHFKKPKTAKEQKSEKLISAYESVKSADGTAKISDLRKEMGVALNTAKKYIDLTAGFKKVKDGYVTYSPANKNI